MYHESTLAEFIDFVKENCDTGESGVITFFVESGGWGKIQLRKGSVEQVRFGALTGRAALAKLAELPKIRFGLRAGETDATHAPVPSPLGNEVFFRAFNLTVKSRIVSPFEIGAARKPASPVAIKQPAESRKPKVLVADDSRVARASIVRTLLPAGFQVVEAASGFDVLGQMENESPDLLILDLVMPGIDGYKVLELLRRNSRYRELPVLILTSRDSLLDKLKGKMSSSDEYLTKPVDPEHLLAVVGRYLSAAGRNGAPSKGAS